MQYLSTKALPRAHASTLDPAIIPIKLATIMHSLIAVSVAVVALFAVATCQFQLPCDSLLQSIPEFSQFFAHCECNYADWTEWATPENALSIAVPLNQCPSELARPEERWQRVIGGYVYECEERREERYICKHFIYDMHVYSNNDACLQMYGINTLTCVLFLLE